MTISNPAKILAAYMRCSGISDAKQLAADLDIPLRTIQRLKLEVATSDTDAKCAISGASENAKRANDAISGASGAKSLACAHKESLSGIDSNVEVKIIPLAPKGGAKPKSENRNRGSRLDPDWTLPDDWRTWARTNFPAVTDEQITTQAENFRDFWISKPGAQACKLDWQATWRMWCRKGLVLGSIRQPQHTGQYTGKTFDKFAHIWEDQVAS